MHYKLLSFQPCSIYQNGGCGRVLRRLYAGKEEDIISIACYNYKPKIHNGIIHEEPILLFPLFRKWMRAKSRNGIVFLQRKLFAAINKRKMRKAILKHHYDILHVVDQGFLLSYLCEGFFINKKKLWVSFHDHYSQVSSYKNSKNLWEHADRRIVISRELGEHYQTIFSNKPFEIITDGVKPQEIGSPKKINNTTVTIYFGGLLHYHYLELFKVFVAALNVLSDQFHFKFIIRGTKELKYLDDSKISIEYRNDFVSDEKIKQELDEADILYLPIKFISPEFYKYSLSTKMIGYLGAPGTILYHGPGDSALCKLLDLNRAAVCCTSLNEHDVISSLKQIFSDGLFFSGNAKELAKTQFYLERKRQQFWQMPE